VGRVIRREFVRIDCEGSITTSRGWNQDAAITRPLDYPRLQAGVVGKERVGILGDHRWLNELRFSVLLPDTPRQVPCGSCGVGQQASHDDDLVLRHLCSLRAEAFSCSSRLCTDGALEADATRNQESHLGQQTDEPAVGGWAAIDPGTRHQGGDRRHFSPSENATQVVRAELRLYYQPTFMYEFRADLGGRRLCLSGSERRRFLR